MAEQLGLQGWRSPRSSAVRATAYVELIVVLEEMGRALLCAPYFSSVALAANLLLSPATTPPRRTTCPASPAGRRSPPWPWPRRRALGRGGVTLEATAVGRQLDADRREAVRARRPHRRSDPGGGPDRAGVSVFAVDKGARRVDTPRLSTMDQTRKQARLDFESTPAGWSAPTARGGRRVSKMLDLAAVALAAEQVGGAQKVLEMAVEYAKVRVQFGRPIGSFQAIKHKCADMLLEVESAKSAAYYAGWAAAEDNDELPVVASLAKSYCSEAYFHATAENIQIHGGIGFTWEHPAHLYFKRAKSSELLFGDPTYHRELLAQRIGI
jgi:hypothetical protein